MANPIVKLVVFGVIYGAYYFLVFGGSNNVSSKLVLSSMAAYATYLLIDILFFGGSSIVPQGWVGTLIFAFFILSVIGYSLYMAYTHF